MNEAIIEKHNKIITPIDTVYVLGDLCLGGGSDGAIRSAKKMIQSLKGNLKVILGNHDTDRRVQMYNECWNVEIIGYADMIHIEKYHFYISHFPTLTSNLDENKSLKQRILNLYGHTHQKTNFLNDSSLNYHVGVDSHNCEPVSIDTVIKDMKEYYDTFLHIPS